MNIQNVLEGKFALAKSYFWYEEPWKIFEAWIERRSYPKDEIVILIRGENTCWHRADQCWVDESFEELQEYQHRARQQDILNKLHQVQDVGCLERTIYNL